MYYHVTSTSFSRLRLVVVCAVLLVGAVKEGYGQVYATHNSFDAFTSGLLASTASATVAGEQNSIVPNSLNGQYTRLSVSSVIGLGGLVGHGTAWLQLKFINGSNQLPPGTDIYVKFSSNNPNLLNLLLSTTSSIQVYQEATSTNNGSPLPSSTFTATVTGSQIKISSTECFNAIRVTLSTSALLLSNATLDIYHAYYECPPPISVADNPTICTGENVTLQVYNPIPESSCDYLWYNSATGGTSIGSGSSFTTDELISTTTFYVGYSGVNPEECGRTPVVVTVLPKPGSPRLTIVNEQH